MQSPTVAGGMQEGTVTMSVAGGWQQCLACGRDWAPARCSRCQSAWFCNSDCQRSGWKEHKPKCKPPTRQPQDSVPAPLGTQQGPTQWDPSDVSTQVMRPPIEVAASLGWAASEEAQELLLAPPFLLPHSKVITGALEARIGQLCQAQKHLDALAEALHAQIVGEGDHGRAASIADMFWGRLGFEPIPPERHDYSLLHMTPPAKLPPVCEPGKMLPFSVEEGQSGDGLFPETGRRHVAALVGYRCPIVDAKGGWSHEVEQELKHYMDIRAPRPCIIKNLPLFQRAVEKWDVQYLAEHMGEQLYHTFASDHNERRFAYFFEERNEGGYETPPIADARKMTFQEFLQRQKDQQDGSAYYLQTPVLRYEDGVITCAKFDDCIESDLRAMDNAMMDRLSKLGSFGPISRNQLFVSFSDFLTAVHYDQQHNLFLQIRGAKRFLLFDAADLPALYSYPVHHPLDRKAMLDLERPDLRAFPRSRALAGRGVEALVEPGDILFMPMSWFHHVHSVGPENVSLNFWFYDSGVLFQPKQVLWPLTSASVVELSRHVEYFVAEQLGPANVGAFMKWWLGDAPVPADQLLADRWRLMRNYVLRCLAAFPRPVGSTVLAMLDPRRWQGLRRRPEVSPAKAIEGLRAEHQVSSLLEGLQELSLGLFRCNMTGQAARVLGRAIDVIPREKLRMFLECAEEVLVLLRDHTDWKATDGNTPEPCRPSNSRNFVFGRDEARRTPVAILQSLGELCDLAGAPRVKVAILDNGLFANWLQVLDARLFAAEGAPVEPDWVLSGQEREFNYGDQGDDVFRGLFREPAVPSQPPSSPTPAERTADEPFVVHRRYNFLLVNVFRGSFLRGPRATRRRHMYAEAARKILRPCDAAVRARDEALAAVPREPGTPLIGVHKRVDNPGTARMQFAQVMPSIDSYVQAVRLLAARRGAAESAVVVLATDDESAVHAFTEAFAGRLICRSEARRCIGGINERKLPLEVHGQLGRLQVKDARDCLVDAMLLAACEVFVHADSNVTVAAGIMNPEAEAVHVRDIVPNAEAGGDWPGYRRCKLPV